MVDESYRLSRAACSAVERDMVCDAPCLSWSESNSSQYNVLDAVVPLERWVTDDLPTRDTELLSGRSKLDCSASPRSPVREASLDAHPYMEKLVREATQACSVMCHQQLSHEARVEQLLMTHQQCLLQAISRSMETLPQARRRPNRMTTGGTVSSVGSPTVPPADTAAGTVKATAVLIGKGNKNGGISSVAQGESQGHGDMTEVVPNSDSCAKQGYDAVVQTEELQAKDALHRRLRSYDSLIEATNNLIQNPTVPEEKDQCPEAVGWRKRAKAVVCHRNFDLGIACVIFINAIFIGIQAEWAAQNPGNADPIVWQVLRVFITGLFTCELFLRFFAEGAFLLSPKNSFILWNVFDVTLVSLAILDEILALIAFENMNTSTVRLLRICRLIRALRIIRVMRFFRDLRVMVFGILSSLKSLMWAIVLLILIMYIFAVLFVQVAAEERQSMQVGTYPSDSQQLNVDSMALAIHFGSLPRAIATLYMSMCGGLDWGIAAEPLTAVHPLFAVLFALYISIIVFCVLNIVTGVFVENANKITVVDQEEIYIEELHERSRWVDEVKALFSIVDGCNDETYPTLTWECFERSFADIRVQACLGKMGLDTVNMTPRALFDLLDFDGNGMVNLDDFVVGLQQLRGHARSVDIARLSHAVKQVVSTIHGVDLSLRNLVLSREREEMERTWSRSHPEESPSEMTLC
eukprot:TRINITY_DN49308_c0_g1_i1.p1 TRINITY_DN49308_c0_g1~~TRINITY_DN49308_c0_g1_i1.p1  ORF type:complete len:693 (+),score=134.49 TRINITY_DN49308_c0_g1_i1:326-2404(+)